MLLYFVTGLHITVPEDPNGTVYLCSDHDCFSRVVRSASVDGGLLITMMVFDFTKDPYIPLYLGWIIHMISDVKEVHHHIVLMEPSVFLSQEMIKKINAKGKNGSNNNVEQVFFATTTMLTVNELSNSALRWIFVSLEHGDSAYGIKALTSIEELNPHLELHMPRVLIHLNHEQPWTTDQNSQDFTFDSVRSLKDAYSKFSLVIRNYYFEPLHEMKNVFFLPLGPSYYGYVLDDKKNEDIPASERMALCYFAGRAIYSAGVKNWNNNKEVHFQQRVAFFELAKKLSDENSDANGDTTKKNKNKENRGKFEGLNGCGILSEANKNDGVYGKDEYIQYISRLNTAIFAPAPPGNSPETFRFYEALETGAIPISVRTKPDRDFLSPSISGSSSQEWLLSGYPGPILNDWHEVHEYLLRFSAPESDEKELDALQKKVQNWYVEMKKRAQEKLAQRLNDVFSYRRIIEESFEKENL